MRGLARQADHSTGRIRGRSACDPDGRHGGSACSPTRLNDAHHDQDLTRGIEFPRAGARQFPVIVIDRLPRRSRRSRPRLADPDGATHAAAGRAGHRLSQQCQRSRTRPRRMPSAASRASSAARARATSMDGHRPCGTGASRSRSTPRGYAMNPAASADRSTLARLPLARCGSSIRASSRVPGDAGSTVSRRQRRATTGEDGRRRAVHRPRVWPEACACPRLRRRGATRVGGTNSPRFCRARRRRRHLERHEQAHGVSRRGQIHARSPRNTKPPRLGGPASTRCSQTSRPVDGARAFRGLRARALGEKRPFDAIARTASAANAGPRVDRR